MSKEISAGWFGNLAPNDWIQELNVHLCIYSQELSFVNASVICTIPDTVTIGVRIMLQHLIM